MLKILMLKEINFTLDNGEASKLKKAKVCEAIQESTYFLVPVEGRKKDIYVPKDFARIVEATDLQHFAPVVEGVSPDAPIVYNEKGGGQSDSPYRLDLVDPKALLDISKVLKEGADKYGENNWKKISINDHLNHLLVHVYAHLAGDKSDKHLAHAACRAIFALGVELEEKK